MRWYCERCRAFHEDNELCPNVKVQLKEHPEWLGEIGKVAVLAGEYELIASQALDKVAKTVNKIVGTNLSYEGTHQLARDIAVFKRLDTEAFCKLGIFNTPKNAQQYLQNATPKQVTNIFAKVNGSGQEVDWVRFQQGKLSSLFQKSQLLNKNAVGVDGTIINRFNGKEITRVTVKAAQSKGGINTNVQQIIEALKKGRLAPDEVAFGVEGTKQQLLEKLEKEINYALSNGDQKTATLLQNAKNNIKVIEKNTTQQVAENRDRILEKIRAGNATTSVTPEQILSKAGDGAIIGAAIKLTTSTITNYVRFKNGEKTKEETFRDIGEDVLKGAIVGAGTAALSIVFPAGAIGFSCGFGVGMYLDETCTNILDEIFGKGAYAAILNECGYIAGTAANLEEMLRELQVNHNTVQTNIHKIQRSNARARETMNSTADILAQNHHYSEEE